MIRDILSTLDTGILAQVGLIAFMAAFAAVLIYAFTLRGDKRRELKNLPLADLEELSSSQQ